MLAQKPYVGFGCNQSGAMDSGLLTCAATDHLSVIGKTDGVDCIFQRMIPKISSSRLGHGFILGHLLLKVFGDDCIISHLFCYTKNIP